MRPPIYNEHQRRQLRSFAWLFTGVLGAIGLFRFWRTDWELGAASIALWAAAGAFLVVGLLAPTALKPLYHAWMWLAFLLNYVVSRILLTTLFVVVLTPMALLARLVGRDTLRRKGAASFWRRHQKQAPREHFERLYVVSELED